ncbi:MAG: DEAD/DEAH box helicase [Alphaproteobacteria bacterium]|nr:DEAD/DEAH box helicase [Alphaproteobacteria bacterium]
MTTKTFAELDLSPKVVAAVEAAGYTDPTPIQAEAIPVAVSGRDVLGIAQTGTGKTASFTLPMISRLETGRARARMPRSLILAPTRELAAQVAQSFEKYGVNHKLTVALLIGGVSMDEQTKKLDRGVDVLIATPGRLIDHFQRGRVMLMGVEILVIDEADRMLDMGFIPDIEKICKLLPPKRQTLFFSATMPPEITRLVAQFLRDPVRIEVAKPATTARTITQRFRYCEDGEDWAKREALRELMRAEDVRNAIVFCNRKRDVAILLKSLTKHGFNAGALHGDMDQKARTDTLDKFRSGEITFLAASDVAARGLDIPDVSHIFNFDLPWQSDDYVHRIGRTGRAGRQGSATSLVTFEDLKLLKQIEDMTGDGTVWIGDPPSDQDIEDSKSKKRRRSSRGGGASAGRGDDRRPASRGGRSRTRAQPEGEKPRNETERADQPKSEPMLTVSVAEPGAEQPHVPLDEAFAAAEPRSAPRNRRERGGGRQRDARGERQPRESRRDDQQDRPARGRETTEVQPASASRGDDRANRRGRGDRNQERGQAGGKSAFGAQDQIPDFLRRPVKRKPESKSEPQTADN